MIRCLIADDEPDALQGLAMLLKQQPDIEVVATCSNGIDAVETANKLHPDLLLLDVQMPGVNGFEVLNSLTLPPPLPAVIFVTAYDTYALRAFEVHALDYLLKPYTDARFYEALQHARSMLTNRQQAYGKKLQQAAAAEAARLQTPQVPAGFDHDRLIVKSNGKVVFLPYGRVVWIEAYDYYIKVHSETAQYLVRDTLKHMESCLPAPPFVRIHRSGIVNINHINEIIPQPERENTLLLSNGKTLKVSRHYRKALNQFLS